MVADLLDLIVADQPVLHGQVRIRGTRVPVSIILDCLAAGMNEDEIAVQYPTLPEGAVRAATAYGALLAKEEVLAPPRQVELKLDENLPADVAAAAQSAGLDVDTVADEGLTGAIDDDVVYVATREERFLVTLDRGLANIRLHPPCSRRSVGEKAFPSMHWCDKRQATVGENVGKDVRDSGS